VDAWPFTRSSDACAWPATSRSSGSAASSDTCAPRQGLKSAHAPAWPATRSQRRVGRALRHQRAAAGPQRLVPRPMQLQGRGLLTPACRSRLQGPCGWPAARPSRASPLAARHASLAKLVPNVVPTQALRLKAAGRHSACIPRTLQGAPLPPREHMDGCQSLLCITSAPTHTHPHGLLIAPAWEPWQPNFYFATSEGPGSRQVRGRRTRRGAPPS